MQNKRQIKQAKTIIKRKQNMCSGDVEVDKYIYSYIIVKIYYNRFLVKILSHVATKVKT